MSLQRNPTVYRTTSLPWISTRDRPCVSQSRGKKRILVSWCWWETDWLTVSLETSLFNRYRRYIGLHSLSELYIKRVSPGNIYKQSQRVMSSSSLAANCFTVLRCKLHLFTSSPRETLPLHDGDVDSIQSNSRPSLFCISIRGIKENVAVNQ